MNKFKAPDINAPRFRSKAPTLLNAKSYNDFLKEYPEYKNITLKDYKNIIITFNQMLWEEAIINRDGIALPKNLGYLIITRCKRPKNNIDFGNSIKYGKAVNYANWESDNYLAKINYSNYSLKYKFNDRELWSFKPVENFKTEVSKTFPKNYKKYILLTKGIKLSNLL